jgi:hypothetical protein
MSPHYSVPLSRPGKCDSDVGSDNMKKLKLLLFLSVAVNVMFAVVTLTFKHACTPDIHLRAAAATREANHMVLQTVLAKLESDETNKVDVAIECLKYALPPSTDLKQSH